MQIKQSNLSYYNLNTVDARYCVGDKQSTLLIFSENTNPVSLIYRTHVADVNYDGITLELLLVDS